MLNTQNDGTDKVRSSSTIPTYRPGRRIPRTSQMEQMEEPPSRKCTRRGSTTIWRSLPQSQVQLSLSHDPPFLPGVIFLSLLSHEIEVPSLPGVIFAALLIYFPSRPSQPPAPSSAVERTEFLAGGDLFICSWQVVIFYW